MSSQEAEKKEELFQKRSLELSSNEEALSTGLLHNILHDQVVNPPESLLERGPAATREELGGRTSLAIKLFNSFSLESYSGKMDHERMRQNVPLNVEVTEGDIDVANRALDLNISWNRRGLAVGSWHMA